MSENVGETLSGFTQGSDSKLAIMSSTGNSKAAAQLVQSIGKPSSQDCVILKWIGIYNDNVLNHRFSASIINIEDNQENITLFYSNMTTVAMTTVAVTTAAPTTIMYTTMYITNFTGNTNATGINKDAKKNVNYTCLSLL